MSSSLPRYNEARTLRKPLVDFSISDQSTVFTYRAYGPARELGSYYRKSYVHVMCLLVTSAPTCAGNECSKAMSSLRALRGK